MVKAYDSYIEPCQLCIGRASEGKHNLISECGWCNDSDTHHQTSSKYAGDIIKLPNGGDGYPYHKSPHPERKYFLGRSQLKEFDGAAPPDSTSTSRSVSEGKKGSGGKWILFIVIAVIVLWVLAQ